MASIKKVNLEIFFFADKERLRRYRHRLSFRRKSLPGANYRKDKFRVESTFDKCEDYIFWPWQRGIFVILLHPGS